MSQEEGYQQMITYDKLLWEDIYDKLAKGDRHVRPGACMSEVVSKVQDKAYNVTKKQNLGSDTRKPTTDTRSDTRPKIFCQHCGKWGYHKPQNCYELKNKDMAKAKWQSGKAKGGNAKGGKAKGGK